MSQTFLRNSEPLSSVKTYPFVFDEEIFQYPALDNKSLIGMESHKNGDHIVTKNVMFRETNVTEGEIR